MSYILPAKILNYFLFVTECLNTYICLFVDDKMPVISRVILLMFCFMLYMMIRLRGREEGVLYKYVSWNEFIHNMLAKGEVGDFSFGLYV